MRELIEDELADLLALPYIGVRIRWVLQGNQRLVIDAKGAMKYRVDEPITTMAELLALRRRDLMRQPNFGPRMLVLLEQALARRGLHLADASLSKMTTS